MQKLAFQQDHQPFGMDQKYSSMSPASYINRSLWDYSPGVELALCLSALSADNGPGEDKIDSEGAVTFQM